jgi:glycosyltransferase involved in cell wall biosynthesis
MMRVTSSKRRRGLTARSRRASHVLLIVENVSLARDHRLRKQAVALIKSGYQVSVICRSDPDNHRYGIRVYEYPAPAEAKNTLGFIWEYGYSWGMAVFFTTKVFLTRRFDAIQTAGNPDIYFTMAAPFRLIGKPVVFDQRDFVLELYEVRYGRRDGIIYRILRWLEWASYRTANHVITVNGSGEEIAYTRGGLARGAVTVVGNGPVLEQIEKRRPRPELKHHRRFLCCWLGMMGPQDSLDIALYAIDHLIHVIGRNDCHFTFLGDGESRDPSIQLAKDLDIREWVTFPGWTPPEEAFTYLSTADLGLEPNLEETVTPVKCMEYMAFELPFVAFDLKETRVLAGEAAAYAGRGDVKDFANLVNRLLDDPSRREEMGRCGRQRVERSVAWDHQENAYLQVYRRLVRNGEQ